MNDFCWWFRTSKRKTSKKCPLRGSHYTDLLPRRKSSFKSDLWLHYTSYALKSALMPICWDYYGMFGVFACTLNELLMKIRPWYIDVDWDGKGFRACRWRITDCVDSLQETQHPYNQKTRNRRSMCLVALIKANSVDDLKSLSSGIVFSHSFL